MFLGSAGAGWLRQILRMFVGILKIILRLKPMVSVLAVMLGPGASKVCMREILLAASILLLLARNESARGFVLPSRALFLHVLTVSTITSLTAWTGETLESHLNNRDIRGWTLGKMPARPRYFITLLIDPLMPLTSRSTHIASGFLTAL